MNMAVVEVVEGGGYVEDTNEWSWRIRCGDPCIMTGEAERRTNGDGEYDVVTTASWREKPKEEQMELENPMWWPLHHDGRSRKKNKINGDGESDVVTPASWRESPKEEQMELETPMWWPLHHDGRSRKKNKWSWRIRRGDHCIMTGEAERRTNGVGEYDVVTPASMTGEAERRTNGVGEYDVVTPASWREKPKEEQMEMENPMWWPLHHDGRSRKKNKINGAGESDVVTTASWREKPKEEQMEMENPTGESDVVTTASWRERPKEEQNNVDGESDVVTTA